MGSIASAVGGIVGGIGGMISGNKAADAANQQAEYLRNLSAEQRKAITDAATAAAARGQFKPVTVTSTFGTPSYTYDSSGRLTGVSTTAAPWLADLQKRQQGLAGQYMGLTESALSAAPQYEQAANAAFNAGTDVYGLARQAAAQQQGLYGIGQEMYGLSRGLQPSIQDIQQTGQELAALGRQATGAYGGLTQQAQNLYSVGQNLYGMGQGISPYAQQAYGTAADFNRLAQGTEAQAAAFQGTGATLQGAGADIYGKAAQALPESYDTAQATQDYYKRMQQLVAPQREQQLAATRQSLFNKGRQGLATGATQAGDMLATNPEMAAYYNAIAQQDLQLANQSEQQALANLAQRTQMGQGLYQSGLQQYQAGLGAQQQGVGALTSAGGLFGQGVGALQSGAGMTAQGANIIGQGVGATQAGIGATQAGLGALQTGGGLIGQNIGAQQAGISGTGTMANILGQGVGATQAGLGAGQTAAQMYGSGTGLFGMAGDIQNQLYRNVAASQTPFATGMQAVTGLEQTAQTPVAQGFQYGGVVTPAEQWAGQIGLTGATAAANVAGQYAPAIANYQYQNSSYSPWGSLLSGMGSTLGSSNMGSWGSLFGSGGSSAVSPSYTQAISNYGSGGSMFGAPAAGWSYR